jgi:hypothetical protein
MDHVFSLPLSGANWRSLSLLRGFGPPPPKMALPFTGSAHTPFPGYKTIVMQAGLHRYKPLQHTVKETMVYLTQVPITSQTLSDRSVLLQMTRHIWNTRIIQSGSFLQTDRSLEELNFDTPGTYNCVARAWQYGIKIATKHKLVNCSAGLIQNLFYSGKIRRDNIYY